MPLDKIRDFSIVAHIDHGKSTLADRFLLATHAISEREFRDQMLDDMDLERERGITIKASAVRIRYEDYILNLIDTPGHVDFSYEVSKSLSAVEGVLLLVDAAQGVEAQTVSNLLLAQEKNLVIIPVITKIDLANADPEKVSGEIARILKIDGTGILRCSAKTGQGIQEIMAAVVERIPPPEGNPDAPLKALIFDSKFDVYKGVIVYIRVFDGCVRPGDRVLLMQTQKVHEVEEIGIFTPRPEKIPLLSPGEVGFLACNIKSAAEVKIGDTVTHSGRPAEKALPGYKDVRPMVFCGLYPINARDFPSLREALEKLRLNDSSFVFEPETSSSLGMGFRAGFLGLLHMDIIQERLEREFDLDLLATAPNVVYRVIKRNGAVTVLENPTKLLPGQEIDSMEEPFIRAKLMIPADSIGTIMQLCQDRRGIYKSTEYLDPARCVLTYELPFSEVLIDFYDRIKSLTRGYGSMDYEFIGYRKAKLIRLDILINSEPVDALSRIVIRDQAHYRGKALVEKLKEVIPRQLFEVVIQAAIGSQIIARESISPIRKHVTGKCYGGDITRKRKLWEKQKAGKKRMKRVGRVELPQEAFISILKI